MLLSRSISESYSKYVYRHQYQNIKEIGLTRRARNVNLKKPSYLLTKGGTQ